MSRSAWAIGQHQADGLQPDPSRPCRQHRPRHQCRERAARPRARHRQPDLHLGAPRAARPGAHPDRRVPEGVVLAAGMTATVRSNPKPVIQPIEALCPRMPHAARWSSSTWICRRHSSSCLANCCLAAIAKPSCLIPSAKASISPLKIREFSHGGVGGGWRCSNSQISSESGITLQVSSNNASAAKRMLFGYRAGQLFGSSGRAQLPRIVRPRWPRGATDPVRVRRRRARRDPSDGRISGQNQALPRPPRRRDAVAAAREDEYRTRVRIERY